MLENILYIKTSPEESVNSYADYYLPTVGWDAAEARTVLNNVRKWPCHDPATMDLVIEVFKLFIKDHASDITYFIYDKPIIVDMKVLHWSYNNNSYDIPLMESQVTAIQNVFLLVDADMIDTLQLQSLDDIKHHGLYSQQVEDCLINMNLIPAPQVALDVPQITVNKAILEDDSTARFSSAIWFEKVKEKTIIFAGAGGIGSWALLSLSRLHPNAIYIYDDDDVEEVNLAGQLYGMIDVENRKVNAIASKIKQLSSYRSIFALPYKFTEESEAGEIMMCGFDSIEARKMYFNSWLKYVSTKPEDKRSECLFIDGRMSAEEFQVFCITGDDTQNQNIYKEQYLFDPSEAEETICSYKQTSYMASIIGGVITNLFINFVVNSIVDKLRDLPFFISYNGESMMFKTRY